MKYPDMSSYIRQLRRNHSLTLNELARMLGYSSPTSLTRLIQASANRTSLQQFADRIHACRLLHLTREESNQLDDLIELYDIGNEFPVMVALRRLLRGEHLRCEPVLLHDEQGNSCSFLAHFAARKIRSMIILNCEKNAIFSDLALLLDGGSFRIEHLLYTDDIALHTVNCLRASVPLIYSPCYSVKTYSLATDKHKHPRGLITSDILLYEYESEYGQALCECIVFPELTRGEVMPLPYAMQDLMRFLPPQERLQQVLHHISGSDLMEYNAFCSEMEKERMVCRIRSDPSLVQIPVQIFRQAIRDQAPPDLLASLRPLADTFEQRQQQLLKNPEPQYHILRRGAMRQFVRTGRLSDHLWCCRPFTMAERIQILRYIRYTLMELEQMHFVFLKDDDALRGDEIIFYEGRGLSIIRAGKDYSAADAHEEALITEPELIMVFKRFIMESTLRYRVGAREDAAAFFEALIAECEMQLATGEISTEVDRQLI